MVTEKRNENLIYLFIWIIVLALPVFTLRGETNFSWTKVFSEWIRISPFMIVFFVNNSFLAPKFLFEKKLLVYIILVTISIFIIVALSDYTRVIREYLLQHQHQRIIHRGFPPFGRQPFPLPLRQREGLSFAGLMVDRVIFSYLVVGFNSAIKLMLKRQEDEKHREELQRIHLQTELSFLRQQISPHFFMNTLNNIHALIEIDAKQSQAAVIKLSKLMRYLLTESRQGVAKLEDEFEFLNSYIDLMRLRYSDRVKISVDFDIDHPERKIHSLLFVSLIENAFKYGVNHIGQSTIVIQAKMTDQNTLVFKTQNSKFADMQPQSTGLGLENLRKQLKLLYGKSFDLKIHETENIFNVELTIPLEND